MKTLQSRDNLIWIDLEMTGLNPEKEKIIEIATLDTDSDLNILCLLYTSPSPRDRH